MSAGVAPHDIHPENTHVRMSLKLFLSVLIGLGAAVGMAVAFYFATIGALEAHMRNGYIHLDQKFVEDHGRPIGYWDLDVWKTQTAKAVGEAVEVMVQKRLDNWRPPVAPGRNPR